MRILRADLIGAESNDIVGVDAGEQFLAQLFGALDHVLEDERNVALLNEHDARDCR